MVTEVTENAWQKKAASNRKDLLVIVDTSSLITLASLINPQDLEKHTHDNPTMLRFLEHLGKLGVEVVIPESMVFESTGWRPSTGTEFPHPRDEILQYDYLRNFLEQVKEGKVKNVHIEQTSFAGTLLDDLEDVKDNVDAYYKKKKEDLFSFGDRDIVNMFSNSTHTGNIFVLTEDRPLTETLIDTKNRIAQPVGIVSALKLCADVQHVSPIPWLDNTVATSNIREYINDMHKWDNDKRIDNGRAARKGLNQMLDKDHKGYELAPEGEKTFAEALHAAVNKHKGRA